MTGKFIQSGVVVGLLIGAFGVTFLGFNAYGFMACPILAGGLGAMFGSEKRQRTPESVKRFKRTINDLPRRVGGQRGRY